MRTFQDLRHGYARAEPSLDRRLIVRGQGGENPVTERIRHLWSSMIGNGQGETEIPVDSGEEVLRAGRWFAIRAALDLLAGPAQWQRGQTSICGNSID
jgi:hypothetical protein